MKKKTYSRKDLQSSCTLIYIWSSPELWLSCEHLLFPSTRPPPTCLFGNRLSLASSTLHTCFQYDWGQRCEWNLPLIYQRHLNCSWSVFIRALSELKERKNSHVRSFLVIRVEAFMYQERLCRGWSIFIRWFADLNERVNYQKILWTSVTY